MAIKRSDDIVGDAKKIVKAIRRRQKIKALVPVFSATLMLGVVGIGGFQLFFHQEEQQVEAQPFEPYASDATNPQGSFSSVPKHDDAMSKFAEDSLYFSTFAYAEDHLSGEERDVYEEVYSCIIWGEPSVEVSTRDPEILKKAVSCVLIDHPEIFFIEDYKFSKYTVDGEIKKLSFAPSYSMDTDEISSKWEKLSETADEVIKNIPMEASDYDKVATLYDYIINNTDYDADAPDNQNIASVLLNGSSVCQGYSKTLQLLLLKLKMPSTLITGKIIGGDLHSWNAVKVEGDWCYVDVTWGDAAYIFDRGEGYEELVHESNYDYLLVPYDDISSTHRADFPVELPECSTSDHSYYVKEGIFVDEFSEDIVDGVVLKQTDLPYVIIKCSDEDTYDLALKYLVDDHKIQDIFPNKSISYSANNPMRKLTFRID